MPGRSRCPDPITGIYDRKGSQVDPRFVAALDDPGDPEAWVVWDTEARGRAILRDFPETWTVMSEQRAREIVADLNSR